MLNILLCTGIALQIYRAVVIRVAFIHNTDEF